MASAEHSSGGDPKRGSFASDEEVEKFREMVVVPECAIADSFVSGDLAVSLNDTAQFFADKVAECEQTIAKSSAVSFTANYLQSRAVNTELGTKLAKLYEVFGVSLMEDFEKKLDELENHAETGSMAGKLKSAFQSWEDFLQRVDKELEKVTGESASPVPRSELGSSEDIQLLGQNKLARNSTLLSYVKNSPYEMLLLELVSSFSSHEFYEHIKKMFGTLNDFHKFGCDLLLLTKMHGAGSGFLKLIGMPFRTLLSENEALKQILNHRQTASAIGGIRTIQIYAEFLCNDHPLEIVKSSAKGKSAEENNKACCATSGCILVNRKGQILYTYGCTDCSDWPDSEVLLEQVRNHGLKRPRTESIEVSKTAAATTNSANVKSASAGENGEKGLASGEVAVHHARRCCTIM